MKVRKIKRKITKKRHGKKTRTVKNTLILTQLNDKSGRSSDIILNSHIKSKGSKTPFKVFSKPLEYKSNSYNNTNNSSPNLPEKISNLTPQSKSLVSSSNIKTSGLTLQSIPQQTSSQRKISFGNYKPSKLSKPSQAYRRSKGNLKSYTPYKGRRRSSISYLNPNISQLPSKSFIKSDNSYLNATKPKIPWYKKKTGESIAPKYKIKMSKKRVDTPNHNGKTSTKVKKSSPKKQKKKNQL